MDRLILTWLTVALTACTSRGGQQPQPVHAAARIAPADSGSSIEARIAVPDGYARTQVAPGSYAAWLRALPLRRSNTVYLYDGSKKPNQDAQYAVLDIDVGNEDLQQCADACMRLRAEYLYSAKRYQDIWFTTTSGQKAGFAGWAAGMRPVVGKKVTWRKGAKPDSSYKSFRQYLTFIFRYCGTYSLSRQLSKIPKDSMKIGDVFLHGGFPGHAVMIVDQATDTATGKMIFLIAQSYMPAQDIHVLRNPGNTALSPWYELPAGTSGLITPEWNFAHGETYRFGDAPA